MFQARFPFLFVAAIVASFPLMVGCTVESEGDTPVALEEADRPLTGDDVSTRRDDTTWTTDSVCKACGCSVSGFVCNCGLTPSQRKLDCIMNGGPTKVLVRSSAVSTGPSTTLAQ
jgi:hypothetical protein